jgi:DNA-binding FadR family transcriptional regulator
MNHIFLKRTNLADQVALQLQQQISLGTFQKGEKLPTEPELMKQFGVGRSTIREAIRILANAGWIRVQQGLGTFVESITQVGEPFAQRLQRVKPEELNEVRLLLELKIAEKAAINRKETDIEKMTFFLQQRKAFALAEKPLSCIEADISFHTCIAEASGNSILADLYKAFAAQLKNSFLTNFITTEAFIETQHLHEKLLESIVNQQPTEAWQWAERITNR